MGVEVEEHVGAAPHERSSGRTGQRIPSEELGHEGRDCGVEGAEGSRLELLPLAPGTEEAGREGAIGGRSRSLRPRPLHSQGGRAGEGPWGWAASPRALCLRAVRGSRRRCRAFQRTAARRPLPPYVWVDATYLKSRQDGRVATTAVVIVVGVNAKSGEREVWGLDVGPSEDGAFWESFLRSLAARGLSGVGLVTSGSHRGLMAAIEAVLRGASWQRCRVHYVRNALSLVPKAAQSRWWGRPNAPFSPTPMRLAPTSSGARWPMAYATFPANARQGRSGRTTRSSD